MTTQPNLNAQLDGPELVPGHTLLHVANNTPYELTNQAPISQLSLQKVALNAREDAWNALWEIVGNFEREAR